ncbi:thioesterase [Duganella sp. FT3S]|uniref:Thioesterase n=1 Tax=Rugamonas fusca TaxID=2758568 RepID=A0A7W2I8Z5_9BURK|nr:alpha/beta hydrolase-fold protein [Rugamonas fusca]MBA5607985.1 thioesterase [Rugamonas fusca]
MAPLSAVPDGAYSEGRLYARPHPPTAAPTIAPGLHTLVFPNGRETLFFAPERPDPQGAPLLLLLHGACRRDGGAEATALGHAMLRGTFLLAPRARDTSWDLLRGGFGPDLSFIDLLLSWTMQHYAIAPAALAIAGFSDGASYALSVGLANGDLFGDILAFSPGFSRPLRIAGQPRVFIAHGAADAVLPVQRGQQIARDLTAAGYAVAFEQFAGGHTVPPQVAVDALGRLDGMP